MLRSILQNSTAGFYIFASDSTTPTSGKTGLTITATLSKAGGSANAVSPTITEIGNGLYWITPIAAHRDTLGEIAWQFSATGAIIAPRLEKVVAVNDQAARFGASDGTGVTLAANQDVRNVGGDVAGKVLGGGTGTISGDGVRAVSVTNGVTLAANQDVRNVGGTLPNVTLAASQPNYAPSKAGDQMDLINTPNATARQAFATTIEAAILNEADATALLAAIANKVETFLINDGDAVATLTAIAAAVNSAIVAGQIGLDLATTKASAATAASQATAAATSAASANTNAGAAKTAAESADGKLTAPRLAKIDGAAQAGADGDTLKTLSDQIDGIGGGGGGGGEGGGTDWTSDERTAIRSILGIPSSGTTPTDPSAGILDTIRDQAVAISAALAGAPVEPTGRIASGGGIVAYIGDDFRVRSGTQLQIPVSDPSGGLYAKLNAIGAANLAFGASRPDKAAGAISGTIASLATSGSGASQLLLITVEISNCGSGLRPGDDYTYQIEDRQTQGTEVDSFVRVEGSMELRKKVV